MLTAPQLHAAMPYATQANLDRFLGPLNATMEKHGINTPMRQAQFLAQVAHESGSLRYTEEIASGAAYEGRHDLGNTQPGDGVRFKGRGLIQLTGRANYAEFAKDSGVDVVGHPELVSMDPMLAAESAGWFWARRNLNALADADNGHGISLAVNGGDNGMADRMAALLVCKDALGCGT